MPSRYLAKYLRLLCVQMPALKELILTATIRRYFNAFTDDEGIDTWTEKHRALMYSSAWIMARSRSLKYAVWDEEGTVVDGMLDDLRHKTRRDDRPLVQISISMYKKKPNFLQVMETPTTVREHMELGSLEEDEKTAKPATVRMMIFRDQDLLTVYTANSARHVEDPTRWLAGSRQSPKVPPLSVSTCTREQLFRDQEAVTRVHVVPRTL